MGDSWFYLVLPSNASMDTFPKNNQHSFKIKIPSPLLPIEGKWVVGLSEIQFPAVWRNVVDGSLTIKFEDFDRPITFKLFDGVYSSIDELIVQIHKIIQQAGVENDITLHYDHIRNRVLLKVNEKKAGFGVTFSQNILNILGLKRKAGDFYKNGTYIESTADITEGFSALYVYADIVQNRIVGDSMVPLLRVVPIEKVSRKPFVNWVRFHHIQYVRVNHTQGDTIEINIRRDNGDIVPFEGGKVVLTLHFKKQ